MMSEKAMAGLALILFLVLLFAFFVLASKFFMAVEKMHHD